MVGRFQGIENGKIYLTVINVLQLSELFFITFHSITGSLVIDRVNLLTGELVLLKLSLGSIAGIALVPPYSGF